MSNSMKCSCKSCAGAACHCGCQSAKAEPKTTGCRCGDSCKCGPQCTVQGGLDERDSAACCVRSTRTNARRSREAS